SAISSSDRTSCTPYASKTASYAPCSPASAPECAVTNAFEASVRPTVSAKTGTSRSAARANAVRNPSGFRTVSNSSAITRVDRRDPLGEGRTVRGLLVERRERDDAAGAELGRVGHRRFDPGVRDAEDREVDRLGDLEQRRVASVAVDLVVPWVDGVDSAVEPA